MKRKLLCNRATCGVLVFSGLIILAFDLINYESPGSSIRYLSKIQNEETMTTLSTYLLFNGNCKEAMEFYRSCFGGELTVTSVAQSLMKNMFPETMQGKTVNARLKSTNIDISASDWLQADNSPIRGNTVCLYLSGGTPRHLEDLFNKLSEKADITNPLKTEAFGTYGALTDQFGVRWMFHTDQKE